MSRNYPRDTDARARTRRCWRARVILICSYSSALCFSRVCPPPSIHPSILLPPALSPPVDFGAGRGPSKSRVGASERASEEGANPYGEETRSFFTFLALGPVARRQPTDHSRRDVFHKEFREMHRLPVYARDACVHVRNSPHLRACSPFSGRV